MSNITTVLFDFDGVVADTEPQYDDYTNKLGERYNLGIENFALKVKGTTNAYIFDNYLNHLPDSEIAKINEEIDDFEAKMDFPVVEGVLDFIQYLKNNGYKVGLVTSSGGIKMQRALKMLKLENIFDAEVTANRITKGKPHPMCYLLAAEDLNVHPSECIVFEDSFHGLQAGKDAGMKIVGVSTTIANNDLKSKTEDVIPHFGDFDGLLKLLA